MTTDKLDPNWVTGFTDAEGGVKLLDYLDFCLAAELVNKKAHLTLEGIEEIRKIKSRMNKNRYDLYNNGLCKTRKIS